MAESTKIYGTKADIVNRYADVSKVGVLTLDHRDCILGHHPTLYHITANYSRDIAKLILVNHLIRFQELTSLPTKLNTWQLDELADNILTYFGSLKVTEFILFLKEVFFGFQYEVFYGRIDPHTLARNLHIFTNTTRKRIYDKESERRKEQELRDSKKGTVSYSEWCKMKGRNPDEPLKVRLAEEKRKRSKTREEIEKEAMLIEQSASDISQEAIEAVRRHFTKKYGKPPKEFLS